MYLLSTICQSEEVEIGEGIDAIRSRAGLIKCYGRTADARHIGSVRRFLVNTAVTAQNVTQYRLNQDQDAPISRCRMLPSGLI